MARCEWILSLLLSLVLLLTACQPVMPVESTAAEEAVMVTDAAELAGVWQVLGVDFDFYHQFNEDGTLQAAGSPVGFADSPLFVGEFWFEDGQLHMREVEVFGIPPCGEEPVIYEARLLPSGNLRLTKIVDNCEPRIGTTDCEHAPLSGGAATRYANLQLIHRYMQELWNEGKLDVASEILAEDFVDHTPRPGVEPTREGLKNDIAGFHEEFAGNAYFRVDETIIDEDSALVINTMILKDESGTETELAQYMILLHFADGVIQDRTALQVVSWE